MADVTPAVPQIMPGPNFDRDARVPRHLLKRSSLIAAIGLLLLVLWTLWMLVHRRDHLMFADTLLSNYFAYRQDLALAPLIILFVGICPFVPPLARRPNVLSRCGVGTAVAAAIGAFTVAYAGSLLVFGSFGLSLDEFMANFDARILRNGALFASVPTEWRTMTAALQPTFLLEVSDGEVWSSAYLPGNAAIRALLGNLANPVMAAASLLLLATSTQFLVTAMTPYAMTAHLALNLAWLWLVLDDRRWNRVLALAVSFLASGLHQMAFHPLFAAPLLLWLWSEGKKDRAMLYGGALIAIILFWINYWPIAMAISGVVPTSGPNLGGSFFLTRVFLAIDDAMQPLSASFTTDNFLRLLSWQNPLLLPLVAAVCVTLRRQPSIARAMLGGIGLMLVFLLVVIPYQGHGWGYRYLHGYLGSFALLGAFGWSTVRDRGGADAGRLRTAALVSLLISLLVLLPLRGYQAHAFAEPYRKADQRLTQIPADVLIVEADGRWYAQDLVRNDPFLTNRPLRLLAEKLSSSQAQRLCATYRVRIIDRNSPELAGLRPIAPTAAGTVHLQHLHQAGCGEDAAPVPRGRREVE